MNIKETLKNSGNWAIFTSENPDAKRLSQPENDALFDALLQSRALRLFPAASTGR